MARKLTILLDDEVYEELHRAMDEPQISHFIESLLRPHVMPADLDAAYREMAADEAREAEAPEWAVGTVGEVADEAR